MGGVFVNLGDSWQGEDCSEAKGKSCLGATHSATDAPLPRLSGDWRGLPLLNGCQPSSLVGAVGHLNESPLWVGPVNVVAARIRRRSLLRVRIPVMVEGKGLGDSHRIRQAAGIGRGSGPDQPVVWTCSSANRGLAARQRAGTTEGVWCEAAIVTEDIREQMGLAYRTLLTRGHRRRISCVTFCVRHG